LSRELRLAEGRRLERRLAMFVDQFEHVEVNLIITVLLHVNDPDSEVINEMHLVAV
jgi:hypothetical protein